MKPEHLTQLSFILDYLEKRFPNGNVPFQAVTRLAEEVGELAKEVNKAEGSGIKLEKHGVASRTDMAKEVQDVLRTVLQVARCYNLENEVGKSIEASYVKAKVWLEEYNKSL
jgi:NTP pyrophosphatase (non-canonical NTP hydrolase)